MDDYIPATGQSRAGGEYYGAAAADDADTSEPKERSTYSNMPSASILTSMRTRGLSLSKDPVSSSVDTRHDGRPNSRPYTSILDRNASEATAIASPNLYSTRSAAKRFPPQSLYREEEPEDYINVLQLEPIRQPAGQASMGFPSGSASPLLQGRSPVLQNDAPTFAGHDKRKSSAGNLVQASGSRFRVLDKRREKRVRDLRRSCAPFVRMVGRPRLSVLILGTLAFIYLYKRSTSPPLPPVRSTPLIRGRTHIKGEDIPEREWWQPSHNQSDASSTREPRHRTSFTTPRHTYEQLQSIPSEYAITSEVDRVEVHAVIDCSHVNFAQETTPIAFAKYMRDLEEQSLRPASVRILVLQEAVDAARVAVPPAYHGNLYPTSSLQEYAAALATFSTLVLVLACPITARASVTEEVPLHLRSAVEVMVRAAGSEPYTGHALALAGYTVQSLSDPITIITRSANSEPNTRSIVHTMALQYAAAPMLFHTSWLGPDRAFTAADLANVSLALHLGEALKPRRKVFGVPVPNPFFRTSTVDQDHLNRAYIQTSQARSLEAMSGEGRHRVFEGTMSPAKVAVFLDHIETDFRDWEDLVCAFHNEQTHGHEVRAFLPSYSTSPKVGVMIGICPDVVYRRATEERLQRFVPDICLVGTGASVPGSLQCTQIVLPAGEVRHAEWLPTLPKESLQGRPVETPSLSQLMYSADWHKPQIDVVVVTNDRPRSLHRLLSSIRRARYLADRPKLFVNMDQTADEATQDMLFDAQWPFGQLIVRRRVIHAGLLAAMVESWYPSGRDSYAVILEDDAEVSPLFYSWAKYCILLHRYGSAHYRAAARRLMGISLYQPKHLELRLEGRQPFDAHQVFEEMGIPSNMPYLSQIPCSWGAVYFPEHWREFHQFLSLRMAETALDVAEPIIPDIRSNRWTKSWKRYLNELIYLRGYTMLYPNFGGHHSLSTNHLEKGTHVQDEDVAASRRELFQVPLLSDNDSIVADLPGEALPSWPAMPVLDFWGEVTTEGELLERAKITLAELGPCPGMVTEEGEDVHTLQQGRRYKEFNAADLLCPRAVRRDVGEASMPPAHDTEAVVA